MAGAHVMQSLFILRGALYAHAALLLHRCIGCTKTNCAWLAETLSLWWCICFDRFTLLDLRYKPRDSAAQYQSTWISECVYGQLSAKPCVPSCSTALWDALVAHSDQLTSGLHSARQQWIQAWNQTQVTQTIVSSSAKLNTAMKMMNSGRTAWRTRHNWTVDITCSWITND